MGWISPVGKVSSRIFPWIPTISLCLFLFLQVNQPHGVSAAHATRSKYNEFCNKTVKCMATAWLTCGENEKCSCAKPDAMTYDTHRRKCVVKAGETCKFVFGEETSNTASAPRFEYLDCVENSNCELSLGICKCISNHFENTENGTCSPQKMADSPCESNEECRSDLGLICLNGKCDCDPQKSITIQDRAIYFNMEQQSHRGGGGGVLPPQTPAFHPLQHPHPPPHMQQRQHLHLHRPQPQPLRPMLIGQFMPQVQQPPRMQMQMRFDDVSDAETSEEEVPEVKRSFKVCAGLPGHPCIQTKCTPNASCYMQLNEVGLYNATCVCNSPSFIPSRADGTCKGNFGNRCRTSSDCHEQFQCLNQQCKCKYGNHQVFDEIKNECKSLISGPCNQTEECVVNAVCDTNNNKDSASGGRPYSSCQCKENYVEFGPGFCRKGFGESCDLDLEYEMRVPPNVQLREPSTQLQHPGRKYYIMEQSTLNFITNLELERQSFIGLNGVSSSRILIEDKCDPTSRLECRGGKCGCEEEMETYDEKRKICVGSVGAFCRQTSGFSNSFLNCVENAECGDPVEKEGGQQQQQQKRSEFAKCKCKKGFQSNSQRQCVKE